MSDKPPLAVALVHYPVLDRRGDRVTSAVTNLDLHDIARIACTYGVDSFYVVTPVAAQQELVAAILGHWREGHGAGYNPDRKDALARVQVVDSLDAACQDWEARCQRRIQPLLTGARCTDGLSFGEGRELLQRTPTLLVLGTGWGLAPEVFAQGWPMLTAICGVGDYNHLPVRAATAIILDRLLIGREVE
ncbi:MAG: hypothetical protein C0621_05865 [Desulfuromonas sp.]|nr:MAG: hypothetical protein C0621_05865 [Desulfuromonas sp.]